MTDVPHEPWRGIALRRTPSTFPQISATLSAAHQVPSWRWRQISGTTLPVSGGPLRRAAGGLKVAQPAGRTGWHGSGASASKANDRASNGGRDSMLIFKRANSPKPNAIVDHEEKNAKHGFVGFHANDGNWEDSDEPGSLEFARMERRVLCHVHPRAV